MYTRHHLPHIPHRPHEVERLIAHLAGKNKLNFSFKYHLKRAIHTKKKEKKNPDFIG